MRTILPTLSLINLLLLSSCFLNTWDTRVRVFNNSGNKISYLWKLTNKSDSVINTEDCDSTWKLDLVTPNDENAIATLDRWEFSLRDDTSKILRIYIFSEDTLLKYGTCKVLNDQIFMKRYDLTYDDLVKFNWRVVYDGN